MLEASTPTEGMCGGVVWDGMKASRFRSLAQAGQMPRELAPYMSDQEFVATIEKVNHSIQWTNEDGSAPCFVPFVWWWVSARSCSTFTYSASTTPGLQRRSRKRCSPGAQKAFGWSLCGRERCALALQRCLPRTRS